MNYWKAASLNSEESIAHKIIRIAKKKLYHRRVKTVFAIDLDDISFSDIRPAQNVDFRIGSYSEILQLQYYSLNYDSSDLAFARQRLLQGDTVIIGSIDHKPVCYGWLMQNQMDLQYKNYRPLPQDVVYSYKIYVDPARRRQGLFQAYYHYMLKHLRRKGEKYLITWIDNDNSASISAHKKFGFKPIGVIHSKSVLFWHTHYLDIDDSLLSQKVLRQNTHSMALG